jgi:hypothetical protein
MTALPNVVSGNAGALITAGTGTAQLSVTSGVASANATQFAGQTITCPGGVTIPAATLASTTNITTVAAVAGAVGSVTGNVGGNVVGSVASVSGNVGGNVNGSVGSVVGAVGSVTGNVGGNVVGSVASVSGAVGSIAGVSFPSGFSGLTVGAIADGVWDEVLSGHLTSGTTGAALNAAGSSGDPLSTTVPGAYGAGTAGFLIGTYLDAAISSRLSTAGYTAPLSAAGTRTALGMAAADLDTQIETLATASAVSTLTTYVDTEVAAIKAKTDNLPAAPAAVSDIPTAAQNAAGLLDLADGVETGWTLRRILRLIASALFGKISGAATTTATFRDVNDTKNRIVATVDADGNRSAVNLDGS